MKVKSQKLVLANNWPPSDISQKIQRKIGLERCRWVKILKGIISKQTDNCEKERLHAMETQGVQLLLLLLCAVSTCWGQGNVVVKLFLAVSSQLLFFMESEAIDSSIYGGAQYQLQCVRVRNG